MVRPYSRRCVACGRWITTGDIAYKIVRTAPQEPQGRVRAWLCERDGRTAEQALTTAIEEA